MNETALLQKILPLFRRDENMLVPPGDDCALLKFGDRCLLAAADQVISNVHYYENTAPERVAAKLLKRNLSDIAAMGGIPRWALLTLAVNGRSDEWMQRFFAGLEACAQQYNVTVAGGDLASLPTRLDCAALTILGEVEPDKVCLRQNARPGELIAVTGALGDTLRTGHHLDFEPRLAEGRFLAQNNFSCCMMDLSDGMAADLPKLLNASGCGAEIELDKLPCRNHCDPRQALSDGEDYELLFTIPPDKYQELQKKWPFATTLTAVGRVTDTRTVKYTTAGKVVPDLEINGYEHCKF